MSNEKHYPLHPGQTQPLPYYTQVPTEEYEALKREVQQLRELTAGNRTTIDDVVEINTLTSEVKALREMNAKAKEEITKLKSENESLEYSVATLDTDLAMERRWRKCSDELPDVGESVLVADSYGLEDSVTMARYTEEGWELNSGMLIKKDWFKYWKYLPKAPEVK